MFGRFPSMVLPVVSLVLFCAAVAADGGVGWLGDDAAKPLCTPFEYQVCCYVFLSYIIFLHVIYFVNSVQWYYLVFWDLDYVFGFDLNVWRIPEVGDRIAYRNLETGKWQANQEITQDMLDNGKEWPTMKLRRMVLLAKRRNYPCENNIMDGFEFLEKRATSWSHGARDFCSASFPGMSSACMKALNFMKACFRACDPFRHMQILRTRGRALEGKDGEDTAAIVPSDGEDTAAIAPSTSMGDRAPQAEEMRATG
ncbi:Hypothetical Protein FCC1311_117712 [Hondaea fermentalgiana]|uniref:Uncharacterized protein n=1 Tax=Hondaea fermentalgiana TaxID=2315210 RepID=A0A2R5FDE1_9STRA|nr:Hypothetical Protein FCC1311_117712 [Hondaea fermentalgiana]|eukprot:GBG16296.1 Hypothetical Protein FCC1311_117712 [Hondaea fermentalgiana]